MFKTITDISKFLKSKGLTNNEANQVVFSVKELSGLRNEDNESGRNDLIILIDEILVNTELNEIMGKTRSK